MADWLSLPTLQAVVGVVLLLAAIYGGLQATLALRPSTCKVDTCVDHLAQNFEEMRLEGDISDEELRNIKSVLGKRQERTMDHGTPLDAGKP